jgi:hypothetical protein
VFPAWKVAWSVAHVSESAGTPSRALSESAGESSDEGAVL